MITLVVGFFYVKPWRKVIVGHGLIWKKNYATLRKKTLKSNVDDIQEKWIFQGTEKSFLET